MSTPPSQNAYSPSAAITSIPQFLFRYRDPTEEDVSIDYKLYTAWVNLNTKGIWYLEAILCSDAVLTAQWRAVAPIVVSDVDPALPFTASADYSYPIGQTWVNSTSNNYFVMTSNPTATTGYWIELSSGTQTTEKFLPDTGVTPVVPDSSGHVGVKGQTVPSTSGIQVTGALNELDIAMFSPFKGDFTFTESTAANPEILTVSQTDNTSAASDARVRIEVGGAAGGSPMVIFSVPGANQWTVGLNNGVSDNLQIALSDGLLSTNTAIAISATAAPGTAVTIPSGDLNVIRSQNVGGPQLGVQNSSAVVGATSRQIISTTANGATSDSYTILHAGLGAGNSWEYGAVGSDKSFQIQSAPADAVPYMDGTVVLKATQAGAITKPLQPSFNAYQTAQDNNQTGDGTAFFIGNSSVGGTGLTERFDQSASFTNAATAGGVFFTAPVAGKYRFTFQVSLLGLTAGHTSMVLSVINSTAVVTYTIFGGNPGAIRDASNNCALQGSILISLAASDIVRFQVTISGDTKTVDIGATDTFICGDLEE